MPSPSRSGAFEADVDQQVEQFTQSVSFDRRLYAQDIESSQVHARMLARQGIISQADAAQICRGLGEIRAEIERGEFQFRSELEDIHMNVEQTLIDRLGDTGRKLHTARSRNDQVATDMRLWVRGQIDLLLERLRQLQGSFVSMAFRQPGVVIPAYTHMRRAQPILAAHYLLACCEKFERDRQRLVDCRKRVNCCSLGSAAVAGTSLPIDREYVAQELSFDAITANSLDSSSDRDFVLEFVFCLSLVSVHLSSWAEDWIIWSTTEFDFIRLPQTYCTGSSIMPQKINPDVLELIRGKCGRVVGALQCLLVLTKGLPSAYNRDLQEDKLPLFEATDTLLANLPMASGLVDQTHWNVPAVQRRIDQGYLDATTLMEHMIKTGIPQRRAHHAVGQLVRQALEQNKALAELELSELQGVCPELDQSVFNVLGVDNALNAFVSDGSTAPVKVTAELNKWASIVGIALT